MEDPKLKREARRRKILENSEKRLQKITRCKLEENDNIDDVPGIISSSSGPTKRNIGDSASVAEESQPNVAPKQDDAHKFFEDLNRAGHLSDSMMAGLNRVTSDVAPLLGTPAPKRAPTDEKFWKKLGFKLTLLAIIVRIIHIFKLGYLFGETVVIPFALFMMTQLGSYQFDQHASGICGPILIFVGISPTKTKNLLVCYNVVTSILVYFAIYFFSFVCAHLTFMTVFGL